MVDLCAPNTSTYKLLQALFSVFYNILQSNIAIIIVIILIFLAVVIDFVLARIGIFSIMGIVHLCGKFYNFFLSLFSRTDNYVDLDSKFEANIVNSTVYLISIAMQLSTFAVNYKVR